MLHQKALILIVMPVDRVTSRPVPIDYIARLCELPRDHSMERVALVGQRLPMLADAGRAIGKSGEILYSLR